MIPSTKCNYGIIHRKKKKTMNREHQQLRKKKCSGSMGHRWPVMASAGRWKRTGLLPWKARFRAASRGPLRWPFGSFRRCVAHPSCNASAHRWPARKLHCLFTKLLLFSPRDYKLKLILDMESTSWISGLFYPSSSFSRKNKNKLHVWLLNKIYNTQPALRART